MILARLSAVLLAAAPLVAGAAERQEWRFEVLLDGSPIGQQSFRLERDQAETRVTIDAAFDVKVLFFTVYSYRHHNEELWSGECLRSMQSETNDNGRKFFVRAGAEADGLEVEDVSGRRRLADCIVSFSYWAPSRLGAGRLLNSQTGEYEEVALHELGEKTVDLRGVATQVRHVALEGSKLHIELWYSAAGDWLALESLTTSGRRLKYVRL